jgi:hypothetical protein
VITSPQHLSDEAVAAFADGVLRGHARERAQRHTGECADCAEAVRVQREAAWALRAAPAPELPIGLVDRLRGVPQNTPISLPTAVVAPDGTTMLATFAAVAPVAAFVPEPRSRRSTGFSVVGHRVRPLVTTAAALALAGALTAGSVGGSQAAPAPGLQHLQQQAHPAANPGGNPGGPVVPVANVISPR